MKHVKLYEEFISEVNEASISGIEFGNDAGIHPTKFKPLTMSLKKNKVKMEVEKEKGDHGYPEVKLTGKRKDIEKVLADIWGPDIVSDYEDYFESAVTEAVNASGYIKAGKLGYNDQFKGRQSLSKTLSLDLGLSPKNEFSGPWIGFDHVAMNVNGKNGGTILDDALTGKYTYDELKKAAADFMGIKESVVNEAKAMPTAKAAKKFEKEVEAPRDAADLASWVYDNYDVVTGLDLELRDEEMDFPYEVEDLIDFLGFDYDEFEEAYGEY